MPEYDHSCPQLPGGESEALNTTRANCLERQSEEGGCHRRPCARGKAVSGRKPSISRKKKVSAPRKKQTSPKRHAVCLQDPPRPEAKKRDLPEGDTCPTCLGQGTHAFDPRQSCWTCAGEKRVAFVYVLKPSGRKNLVVRPYSQGQAHDSLDQQASRL